ncbi:MAG: ABC transporter ATP-binding protein [Symploca sp. SIO3C6]|nr:ABC transporter ATP-binding protein [Symploca sp. SIO3C6]
MTATVLDVRHLKVQFQTDEQPVLAVDGINFQLNRGQTLGIVGESGSGKSVTSLAVMGLLPGTGKITSGEVYFHSSAHQEESVNLLQLSALQRRFYRGGQISMIFQEPMSSLNPVYTCGFQLTEAIRLHQDVSQAEARRQAVSRLQEVRLLPSDQELRKDYLEEYRREHPNKALPGERAINRQINQQKLAMLKRYPHELSGGQLQRVMIAMAISCNPEVLIADEPTTALDVTVQAAILDLLRELRDKRGMSIVFITHDLGVIAEIADRVAVMYQGKIVESADVMQIFSNPQHPYTKGLLACRPTLEKRLQYLPTISDFMEITTSESGERVIQERIPEAVVLEEGEMGREGERRRGGEGDNLLVPIQQGIQDSQALSASAKINSGELRHSAQTSPLLAVSNLQVGFPVRGVFGKTKRYIMAVNDVSFEVYPGETLGVVGESGCGKSTLAKTILRLIEPLSGQIFFEGKEITALAGKPLRRLRRQMQIVFQNPFSSLDPRFKIGETIMEPLLIHNVNSKGQERRDRAAYLLERVGLNADWMNRYAHEFSGGQRQRICIARALALNPKLIICDESVSALDVSVQAQVLNLLKELQSEFGLTYIFISHDLSVVKFMSDRILVMNQGKIEEIDQAENIYRQPRKEYTRQLIASIPIGSLERIKQQQLGRRTSAILAEDPWLIN